jgi:hypothetical protein
MAWERMAMVSCWWVIDLKIVAFAIVRKLSDRAFCSLGVNPYFETVFGGRISRLDPTPFSRQFLS